MRAPADVIGVGYQGRTLDDFVRELRDLGVRTVVDVRLTPVSRKRGFSKRSLSAGVRSVGIRYEHCPALGNPKDNRPGFAGTAPELAAARARYRSLLGESAERALNRIEELAEDGRVALLCFEVDEDRCHRHVLLRLLAERRLR